MSYLKSNTRQPRLDFEVDIQDTGMKDVWKKARKKAKEALEKGRKWYEKGKRVANAAREEMRKNSSDA